MRHPRLVRPAPGREAAGARRREPRRQEPPVSWRNLDTVREDELRRSVALLGVRVLRMLDYAEGELDQGRTSTSSSAGWCEPIRMHRPEVILTFGPDGVTGDADHVVLSPRRARRVRARRRAARLRGRPRGGPGRLARREALPPRRAASRRSRCSATSCPAEGYGSRRRADTLTLELGELAQLKLAAIARHVSQTGSAGPFHDWGPEVRDAWLATEHYRLAALRTCRCRRRRRRRASLCWTVCPSARLNIGSMTAEPGLCYARGAASVPLIRRLRA